MAHIIRLVDGTTHPVESTEIVESHLNIDMSISDRSLEDIESIFENNSTNLARIGLEQPEGEEYGHFSNFTKYAGIFKHPDEDIVTIYLIQPVDVTEQRLTSAESFAAEALSVANDSLNVANSTIDAAAAAKTAAQSAAESSSTMAAQFSEVKTLAEDTNSECLRVKEASEQSLAKVSEVESATTIMKEDISAIKPIASASMTVAKKYSQDLSDEEALQAKILYDEWYDLCARSFKAEKQGYKFAHTKDGTIELYKTMQPEFLFQSQWEPGTEGTESLYSHIDEEHAGTQEDPIPYKKNMELFEGKSYTENDVLYVCTRSSGIPLNYNLADIVGHFVDVVNP